MLGARGRKKDELDVCPFFMSSQYNEGDRCGNKDREKKLEQETGARV